MTPNEFNDAMKKIYGDRYDEEGAHVEAELLMMKVLIDLGYERGVNVFDAADKWYA